MSTGCALTKSVLAAGLDSTLGNGSGAWTGRVAQLLDEEESDAQEAGDYFLLLETVLNCSAPCNVLVFGVDWDAALLSDANALGRTVFLEDNVKWATMVRRKVPCLNSFAVQYSTRLRDWPEFVAMETHSRLEMTLPLDVVTTPWDIIIVQGPSGDPTKLGAWDNPGRMQSIYTAAQLAQFYFQFPARNPYVDVLVFDAQRMVENKFATQFLGKHNVHMERATTRLYRLHEGFEQGVALRSP